MKPIHPSSAALLLIDVINDFEFPASSQLMKFALPAAKRLAALRRRAREAGMPVIYVNDNFGHWQSDFREQIERCSSRDCPGHAVAGMLTPERDDYFVLKPKHSGFYSTSLEVLLGFLGTRTLVLGGFATDICVIYTANDAYMRDFELVVVADGVAAETATGNKQALLHMKERLKARVVSAATIIRELRKTPVPR